MNENEIKDSKGFAALMRLIRPKQWIKNMFIFVHIIIERVRKKAQLMPSFRFYLYLCHT